MIALEDLLKRRKELDRRELTRWVENRWVLPERRDETWIFHEVDVARIELILEIRHEFAIDEEARRVARGSGTQRDAIRRQLEIEQVGAHPPLIQA